MWDSLTTDNGTTGHFTGLSNYAALFRDTAFNRSLLNTFLWLVGTLVLPVMLGLAIAVMTSSMRGGRYARMALVLPYPISGSATAVVWGFILRSEAPSTARSGGSGCPGASTNGCCRGR